MTKVSIKPVASDYGIYMLITVAIAVSFFSGIWDPDFFWHLATGRWIVENVALPGNDPFGVYTGTPSERVQLILKGYWLCQLLYQLIFSSFGFVGLAVFKSATFLSLFAGQLWLLRARGCGIALATAQAFFVYHEMLPFRADRPQMFSYLGALLVVLLIELKYYRWLPLVMLIWANMHGGFLVGVLIISIYVVIATAKLIRKQAGEPGTLPWYLFAIVSAGVNPNNFLAIKEVIIMQAGEYQRTVFEYMPPITLARNYHKIYWAYFLVLFVGLTLIILFRKRIPTEQVAVFLSLSALSLTAIRYMPFILICGSVYIALWLSPVCGRWGRSAVLSSLLLIAMGLTCLSDVRYGRGFSYGVEGGRYPEKAIAFINETGIKGTLFCNDFWGGYALLNAPRLKLSNDTRALSPKQFTRSVDYLYDVNSFNEFMTNKYDIILTSAFNLVTGDKYQLWQQLLRSQEWGLLYADEIALVFVRNAVMGVDRTDSTRRILDHALKQALIFTNKQPDNATRWENLADIYLERNEIAFAGNALRKALENNPNDLDLKKRVSMFEQVFPFTKR
jgi:hypothetical protein